jgi:hypothetical protein
LPGDAITSFMKQAVRAMVDNAASHRAAILRKQDPALRVKYILDDTVPRAMIELIRDEKIVGLEFVESPETAGRVENTEDYVDAATQFGSVTVHFPEEKFPRDIALTIFNDLEGKIRAVAGPGARLLGFVYQDNGTFKKTK